MLIDTLFTVLALVCGPLYVVTAGRALRIMRGQPYTIGGFYLNTVLLSLSGTFYIVGLSQLLG